MQPWGGSRETQVRVLFHHTHFKVGACCFVAANCTTETSQSRGAGDASEKGVCTRA